MTAYPFIFHSISLSLFASVIGPFGGFFASGFKRAFRIKVSLVTSSVLQHIHCVYKHYYSDNTELLLSVIVMVIIIIIIIIITSMEKAWS